LGVKVVDAIDSRFEDHLTRWVHDDKKIQVNFPDETAQIVDDMVKKYAKSNAISA